jgi:protein-L-isoaspartate(D-aspartate) O-methyltransferase
MNVPEPHPAGAHESSQHMMLERLARRGIRDPRVLGAMAAVPRALFVPPAFIGRIYADRSLPLPLGQAMSSPYVVAVMTEALHLDPHDRVLEIGTGSGYSAAVLSELAAHVDTIERLPGLAASAAERLVTLGYRSIDVHCGDGSRGWPAQAPYHAIVVTACSPQIPRPLLAQLSLGGRLVMPVGDECRQHLVRVRRISGDQCAFDDLGPVQLAPLIGGPLNRWT